ncbi:MAG: hypothetical protein LBV23_07775 [Deltaproteobacteria bacterium]|nr:hypothetical protein [Deltaproteobacteria bacterium]
MPVLFIQPMEILASIRSLSLSAPLAQGSLSPSLAFALIGLTGPWQLL